MNIINRYRTVEPSFQSSELAFPAAPFPRKYVHCVFDDAQNAVQAVLTLLAAGYGATNVHILVSREYLAVAAERRRTLVGFLASMDLNEYVQEANRGHSILVVRPRSYEQIPQIRHLLAPHHAHLMKYIDTWTTSDLLP